jgi:hypothetical protein
MKMKNAHTIALQHTKYLILFILLFSNFAYGKSDSLMYRLDYTGVISSGDHAPFWLQSNRFGKISPDPFSSNLGASVYKDIKEDALFDYGFNADFLIRTGNLQNTEVLIQQLYFQAKWWIFDLTLGAKELYHGCHPSSLTSGGYLFSGNARPMPGITAGIEDFTFVPFTKNLLEIKGALSHKWFVDGVYAPGIFLHHKYLYARIGGNFPVRLQVGLDHAAQWGGNIPGNGEQKFNYENYKSIFFGHSGGEGTNISEQINALGNHIISEHIKFEVQLSSFDLDLYWQTVAEDGPIRLLPWQAMNRKDGLWGFSISNEKFPYINEFIYEFFNTLDQSGPWHDKDGIVYGGSDSYFTNGIYKNDWTHFGRTIGNPLILSPVFNKDGSFRIIYNDVQAHHLGMKGNINGINYRMLGTFSSYYFNNEDPAYPNTSWLLEISKKFENLGNTEFSISAAGDSGEIPGKTFGLMFSVRKNGILFQR